MCIKQLFLGFILQGILIFYSSVLFAQHRPVQGTVVSVHGEPLPSISIKVKSGREATSTDAEGKFTIPVAANATLLFSGVGYTTLEVAVQERSILRVILTEDMAALNEVVVVGYGEQKKASVLGAISSFDAKTVQERPIARVEEALIGQMPGVQVRQQTGMPGSGLSILVRGAGSVNAGNEPLYVIDGFPLDVSSQNAAGGFGVNPLNSISPNDIESVQVLKDAAAGAIYGSRAANGVVLITTKRGKNGQAKITLNANTGFSNVAKKLDVLSPEEWIEMATEVANTNWVRSGTGRTANQTNDERRAILGLGEGEYNVTYMPDDRWLQTGYPGLRLVDWQEEIYRTGLYQNYDLSASGGTDHLNYFVSGNYLNQKGNLLNSSFRNFGARANLEARAKNKWRFGLNLNPSYSETNNPGAEGKDNVLMNAATLTPVVEADAGLETNAGPYSNYGWATARLASPVAVLNNTIGLTKRTRILSSIYAEYEILPNLKAKTTVNYDDINQTTKAYVSDYVAVGGAADRISNPGKNASGSYNGFRRQNFVNENTLNYIHTFNNVHNLNVLAGISYNWVHNDNFGLSTAGGYANNIIETINNAIPNNTGVTVNGNTTENTNTLFSYFGRVQYDYEGKYLLSASIRRDASSKFGSQSQWGAFPSASVGWRISEEDFLKSSSVISDLKLRFSYGKSGNNNIGNYNAIPVFTQSAYNFGGNTPIAASGQVLAGLANAALKWETANTYDAGLDASLWGGRLSLVVDVYQKRNKDLLLNLPVLGASGFSSSLQNIGEVQNKGLEIGINSVNIVKGAFTWSTSANIAFNSNKVLSLNQDGSPIYIASAYSGSNPPFILQPGLLMFSYYITKTDGILTQADIDNPNVAKVRNQTAGDPKYVDANGDGVINADDRQVGGQPTPKYTWSITNTISYKNFDLSVQIYGQQGGAIMSFLGRALDFSGSTTANVLGIWRDRWTADSPNYEAPRGKFGANYTVPAVTSDWIYSSDFWRIQNITLGYKLNALVKKGVFSSARIYASLQNFFGHDKYTGGVNPEAQNTNVSGNGSYPLAADYGAMPLSKTASLGINITF
ncbi:TonB-dependent receptor [Olivibacter sp. CPCC 100613]|uniref:SusC/RagA family TonB-linked outer membrane protein n=1 Tax=Olivibacter sp. CPCC 100613 TaxID=3079931 RepID=UPI002FF51343